MGKFAKKAFWILGLAYLIDRISYPEKYKKKEPELTMDLKYTTASGEEKTLSSQTIALTDADNLSEGDSTLLEDPIAWKKNQKKSSPFVDRGIKYHLKARGCDDAVKAEDYYRKSVENWIEVAKITHSSADYRQALTICWEGNLVDEVEKHLNDWLAEFPKDSDAHSNLARLLHSKGNKDEAKKEYLTAISLDRKNQYCYQELSKIYLEEGDVSKSIEVYKDIINYYADDVDSGIHGGLYEKYIKLCIERDKLDEVIALIRSVFLKIDDLASGKCRPKLFAAQDAWWYPLKRKDFTKQVSEALTRELKLRLKNSDISYAKRLIDAFDALGETGNNEMQLTLSVLRARVFRKEKRFNESWPLYNKVLPTCHENKQLSLLYSDMGDQLFEENKVKASLGMYLYALSLTNNYPAATSGLKKVLKSLDLKDSYESLVETAKQTKDLDKIKAHVDHLQLKTI